MGDVVCDLSFRSEVAVHLLFHFSCMRLWSTVNLAEPVSVVPRGMILKSEGREVREGLSLALGLQSGVKPNSTRLLDRVSFQPEQHSSKTLNRWHFYIANVTSSARRRDAHC